MVFPVDISFLKQQAMCRTGELVASQVFTALAASGFGGKSSGKRVQELAVLRAETNPSSVSTFKCQRCRGLFTIGHAEALCAFEDAPDCVG